MTPIYALKRARSGSDKVTASTSPLCIRPRRYHHSVVCRTRFHEIARAAGANKTNLEDVPGQSPENDGVGGFLGRANDPVPDPVCVSGAGARAPAHPALCRHRTSHRGVDGAAASKTLMLCRLVVEAPKLAHNIPEHGVAGPACERVSGQL